MKKFMALACAMVIAIAALTACGGETTVEDPTDVLGTEATEIATIVE